MEGRCWTSPSLASGRLFVRNLEELVAYDVRADGEARIASATPATAAPSTVAPEAGALELSEVLERYEAARGGLERWREVDSLRLEGTFSAFSESSPFTLLRARGDLYRFEFGMIGGRDAHARDAEGLWWVYHLFGIEEPARVAMEPYHRQLTRESMFEPALLGAKEKGIRCKLVGPGAVDAQPTIDVELTFPDESVETWRLHPETFLEVAVDDTVVDMTQAREPMTRRTFFSDFRTVDGLVLPFHVASEFGARLEELAVEAVTVDPELPADAFDMATD